MSLRGDAAADNLTRTTNTVGTSVFTVMGWVYRIGTNFKQEDMFDFGEDLIYLGVGLNDWLEIKSGAAGGDVVIHDWIHVAMVANFGAGSSHSIGYFNGNISVPDSSSGNVNANKYTIFNAAPSVESDSPFDGRMASIKLYHAELTQAEIQQEMWSFMPIRTAGLNTWLPCDDPVAANNALDRSGNGNDMTVNGTFTVEDGPPIPWRQGRRRTYFPPPAAPAARRWFLGAHR